MHLYCEDFVKAGLAIGHCVSCHEEAYGEEDGWALPEVDYHEHTAHVCCPVGAIIAGMTDEDWAKVIACAKEREEEDGF